MSDLLDHRDAFNALINDAHGSSSMQPATTTILPPGHIWVPHVPKAGPPPPRTRRPNRPDFIQELFS
jgi:hypothetical protein